MGQFIFYKKGQFIFFKKYYAFWKMLKFLFFLEQYVDETTEDWTQEPNNGNLEGCLVPNTGEVEDWTQ